MSTDTRPRVNISNGTLINLKLVVDDATSFNRYVIKEHGSNLQGDDVFGKAPTEDCAANCIYDELSGWLDNPNMLGFTILDITFDKGRINGEDVEISIDSDTVTTNIFNLIKLVGDIASKDHTIEGASNGAEVQLRNLREKARLLLKNLVQE